MARELGAGLLSLLCLCVFIWFAGAVVQAFLRGCDLQITLLDTSGSGIVLLYVITVVCIHSFSFVAPGCKTHETVVKHLLNWRKVAAGFLLSFGMSSCVCLVGYSLLWSLGHVSISAEAWDNLDAGIIRQAMVAQLTVILLAIGEEYIFRGFLLNYLRTNTQLSGTITAIVGSSLIFALSHQIRNPAAWLVPTQLPLLCGLFTLGILLSVAYLASGSLAYAVGVHAGLLGVKVFLRKTQLVAISQSAWWLGTGGDLRTAPVTWLFFGALGYIFWQSGTRLTRLTCIEHDIRSAKSET